MTATCVSLHANTALVQLAYFGASCTCKEGSKDAFSLLFVAAFGSAHTALPGLHTPVDGMQQVSGIELNRG